MKLIYFINAKNVYLLCFFYLSCGYGLGEKNNEKKQISHFANNLEEALINPHHIKSILLEDYNVFPEQILKLTNLEQITFRNSSIKEISNKVRQLEKVTKINIEESNLFPNGLYNFPKLNSIYLIKNNFIEFPSLLCGIKTLKVLKIIDSFSSKKLDSCFYGLYGLEELTLGMLNINKIDKGILKFNHLKTLSIVQTDLSEVPNFIFDLPKLKVLSLEYNKLPLSEIRDLEGRANRNLTVNIEQDD